MITAPIAVAEHANLVKKVLEDYKTHCFWIHEGGDWSHQPWDFDTPQIAQENWEGFADNHGFDEVDETLKTAFLDAVANIKAYYTNLITLDPNWSPIGDGEDVSDGDQVTAIADGDDPINLD